MDIVCLMGLFPDEYREEIEKNSKVGMQNAADKLQWAIVRGLDQLDDVNVSIVNSLYIGSYPKLYRKLFVPTFNFNHSNISDGDESDINVGFCNLLGLKWISRYRGIKKALKKWAKNESCESKILLIYALTTPFVNIAKYIKKRFPDIKVCVVVPDLPDYMNVAEMSKKGLYYHLKNIEIKMIRRCIRDVDSFVLLTDAMKEWFDRPITYTVVEGISSVSNKSVVENEKKKQIIYAGGIKAEYGVIDMANAFANVNNSEWELVIYGDGSDMNLLIEISKNHPTIKLMGRVPNSVVVEAQKEASVLINPRKNQEFTKYSFPSKILEYMSSGTPVMAYKLDGIPNEYDGYYYKIDDSENGLEEAFRYVMSISESELQMKGEQALKFVAEHKNSKVQCLHIIDMLKALD